MCRPGRENAYGRRAVPALEAAAAVGCHVSLPGLPVEGGPAPCAMFAQES